MSAATNHHTGEIRDSYLELVKVFPLTSIRNRSHLKEAQCYLDALFARGSLDEGEEIYLEALSDLIAHYEAQHVDIGSPGDAEVLRYLMEAHGISQCALASDTGIVKSTISAVLAGKRPLTRSHIAKLAKHFGVGQGAFAMPEAVGS